MECKRRQLANGSKNKLPPYLSISTGRKKKNTNQDLPVYPFEAQNFNIRLHMGCGLTLADS